MIIPTIAGTALLIWGMHLRQRDRDNSRREETLEDLETELALREEELDEEEQRLISVAESLTDDSLLDDVLEKYWLIPKDVPNDEDGSGSAGSLN